MCLNPISAFVRYFFIAQGSVNFLFQWNSYWMVVSSSKRFLEGQFFIFFKKSRQMVVSVSFLNTSVDLKSITIIIISLSDNNLLQTQEWFLSLLFQIAFLIFVMAYLSKKMSILFVYIIDSKLIFQLLQLLASMSRIFQTQNQFIIRFPQSIAEQLQAYFQNPDNADMPQIELDLDRQRQKDHSSRIALKVKVGEKNEYKATVMELPTISSTFKTIDRVNFFKSNDISEMILVHQNESQAENIYQDMAEKVMDKQEKRVIRYNCESGITTPTKYIRQQNFKVKPDIDRTQVSSVDREMESIRYDNSQQRQKQKNENKEKKAAAAAAKQK